MSRSVTVAFLEPRAVRVAAQEQNLAETRPDAAA